jgi:phosphate transport system protein
MQAHPDRIPSLLKLLAVARSLERIAGHARNVAADAIYLVEGRIVRHGAGNSFGRPQPADIDDDKGESP